jgi:hypothetical protein
VTFFDPVLETYARAGAGDSDRALADLLGGGTERAIRGIIAHTLGSLRGRLSLDAEDVHADVVLQLVARLHRFKSAPEQAPIEKFAAYVASTTYRTCYSCLRRLYPGRTRLKSRIRYALASDSRFTIRQDEAGVWRCGPAAQTVPAPDGDAHVRFERDPIGFARDAIGPMAGDRRRDAASLIEPVLLRVGQPVDLDRLVDAVAAIVGIDERPHTRESIDDPDQEIDVADGSVSIAQTLMDRQYLSHLWDEVRELPVRQRVAVLLNLRDEDGQSALPLLPVTGIATIREIAAALEMPAQELAQLWRDLPLDDERIGSRLSVTRQQVINLRKSARARLGRRMLRFGNKDRK